MWQIRLFDHLVGAGEQRGRHGIGAWTGRSPGFSPLRLGRRPPACPTRARPRVPISKLFTGTPHEFSGLLPECHSQRRIAVIAFDPNKKFDSARAVLRNRLIATCGTLISVLVALPGIGKAQAATLDDVMARVEKLEKENSTLRDRVRQLEAVRPKVTATAAPASLAGAAKPNSPGMAAYPSAGMPVKAAPVIPVPYASGWAGFYAGGHGGGGWARESFEHAFNPEFLLGGPAFELFSGIHDRGAIFGGQFGYNWQPYASWVVGFEADISGTTIKKSETHSASFSGTCGADCAFTEMAAGTLESKIRDLGTVRGKIGFVPWSNILVYGTGGLAWGQIAHASTGSFNETCTGSGCFSPFGGSQNFSETSTLFGWAAGAGADWKLWNNLVLGVLYLHYDLGKTAFPTSQCTVTPNGCFTFAFPSLTSQFPSSHVTADAITARLSWLFAPAPPPIAARY
jgi:opacity protein-like surface antigen